MVPMDINSADVEKIQAESKSRREKIREHYQAIYPNVSVDESFIFDVAKAEIDEKPCAACQGFPCAKKFFKGARIVVELLAGSLYVSYKECAYSTADRKRRKLERMFRQAKIPAKYAGKTFADYAVDANNQAAVRWAKFIVEHPNEGLYIFGEAGCGKTLLMAIIAQELLKQGKSVIFCDVPNLLDSLKESFDKDSETKLDELMAELQAVDVLILDDLGTENPTEWAVERLYVIINDRYNTDKPVIVTSNFNSKEVAIRLNHPKNAREGIMGDQIRSRLSQMCRITEIKGADRRLTRRKN